MWKKIVACFLIVAFLNLIAAPNFVFARSYKGEYPTIDMNTDSTDATVKGVMIGLGALTVLIIVFFIVKSFYERSTSPAKESKELNYESKILSQLAGNGENLSGNVALFSW